MLSDIVRGQEVTDTAEFFNEYGAPLVVSKAPTFTVRDFHGNLITKGSGAQNPTNPQQWTASFTIPDHCPITDNTYYTLTWTAIDKAGSKQTNVTRFSVSDNLEDYPHEEGQVAFYQQSFIAKLHLPFQVTGLSLRICRDNANGKVDVLFFRNNPNNFAVKRAGRGYEYAVPVIVDSAEKRYSNGLDESSIVGTGSISLGNQNNPTQTNTYTTTNADGSVTTSSSTTTYGYNPNSPIVNPGAITGLAQSAWGYNSLFLYWNYQDKQGNQETVTTRLYVVNGKMVRMMDDLRRQADRIRNKWTIPQLRLTDVDLAHFCIQGMDKFNSVPPSANGTWTLGNLPEQLYDIVLLGALVRFLQAQELALAETEFSFAGQAVQLNTNNRSAAYSRMADKYDREFYSKATSAKKGLLRSRLLPQLAVTWGPTSNISENGEWTVGGMVGALPFLL